MRDLQSGGSAGLAHLMSFIRMNVKSEVLARASSAPEAAAAAADSGLRSGAAGVAETRSAATRAVPDAAL